MTQDPTFQEITALAQGLLSSHYCENDVEAVIQRMDPEIVWVGAAEHEYASGRDKVAEIFRQFAGKVPRCNLTGLESQVMQVGPDVWLFSGRVWISTDSSTQISLRAHQRITFLFRRRGEEMLCCHIHVSNPYEDMKAEDLGFPLQMAQQSSLYLQEQIELQKQKIAQQTALLERLSFEDSLTGVYNRNRYNQLLDTDWDRQADQLGIACLDLNGLKQTNDLKGHSAGDALLCRLARQLQQVFPEKVYRLGGDEFVVIDPDRDRRAFQEAVQSVQTALAMEGVSCSVGTSWRSAPCSLKAQMDEADSRMYWDKRRYYDAMTANPYNPYHD